jgi:cytochrome c
MGALVYTFLLAIPLIVFPLSTTFAAAIHEAAKGGDIAKIAAALDAGADVNDAVGSPSPLYQAVRRGHLEAAKFLIERGADANADEKAGRVSPLMAAVTKAKVELIELLLASGADPNTQSDYQNAIHVAAKIGCLPCVKALVAAGADVNARTTDEFDRTALHLARMLDYGEVADHLLSHGATITTPALVASDIAHGNVDKGKTVFDARCTFCHNAEAGEGRKTGPNLWGIVGRAKASEANMNYSKTLQAMGGVWDYEALNAFLYGPTLTAPGTLMEVRGVPDDERGSLIAYLRTLSDAPLPLP